VRRMRLFELHEQPWLPTFLRDEITGTLHFGLERLNAYTPVTPVLRRGLDSTGARTIVDMCSGGGGPWPSLSRHLHDEGAPLHILLTDKHPNSVTQRTVGSLAEDTLDFYPSPVDARRVPHELHGFRTVFTSFHHFSPAEARAVLQNAVDAGEGIGVFEVTRRTPGAMGMMFLWALHSFVSAMLMRPVRISRLFWTFAIPLIPAALLFDGIASCMRSYRPQELREIIAGLTVTDYEWEVGERAGRYVSLPITYLIGYPRTRLSS
jgi:hypothetical protein